MPLLINLNIYLTRKIVILKTILSQIKLTIGNLLIKIILIIPHIVTHLKYTDYRRL